MPMLSATSASKNERARRGSSSTIVRDTSTWRIDNSHQYPAARSAVVNGVGISEVQRSKNACTSPGPNRSQIACNLAGSAQVANPLASAVKPIPACSAWSFAHSWPFTHTLAGYGK
jgi:hypothetical protein